MTFEPPDWAAYELSVMRVALALVMIQTHWDTGILGLPSQQRYPIGLARFVDLTWLGRLPTRRRINSITFAAILLYAVDWLAVFALIYLACYFLAIATLRSSDGAINHGGLMLVTVLVAQAGALLYWNLETDWAAEQLRGPNRAATAAWWSVQAVVAIYLTSGLAKLRYSGLGWIRRSPGLLLNVVARSGTERSTARGGSEALDRSVRMAGWLMPRPHLAMALFGAGLIVELLTPLALLGRWPMFAVGLALIALHQANGRLLHLSFPAYQQIVLIYFVNVPYLVVEIADGLGVALR